MIINFYRTGPNSGVHYIDLDKLFSFARETGDFFTKDSEKHCYTNKDKSIDVYKDAVAINVATEANITKGLKLAQSQFGNLLEIKGSDEFKSQSIKVLAQSQELKDIKLSNPEHQVELNKLRADFVISLTQPQEQELSIRERVRQRLSESTRKPPLEPVKQQEDQKLGQGLSAREIARQRVNNTEFRPTREVVNDYNKQKEKENNQKQQPQEKTQTKVKEQIKEIDHSRSRGGWER